jgi:hypothetical protein
MYSHVKAKPPTRASSRPPMRTIRCIARARTASGASSSAMSMAMVLASGGGVTERACGAVVTAGSGGGVG